MKSKSHSQIIRKLNPRKSPRIPPQSATRDMNGNTSTSFLIKIFSLVNIGNSFNPWDPHIPSLTSDVSAICKNTSLSDGNGKYLTLYSIKVQGIRQFVLFIRTPFPYSTALKYCIVYLANIVALSHRGRPSTLTLLQGGWHPIFLMTLFSTQWPKL